MAYGKKNYGCLKAFLFAWFVLAVGAYTFYRIAPKTAHNAKEEVLERILGTDSIAADTIATDTVKIDSVVTIPDTIPEIVPIVDNSVTIPIGYDGKTCHIVCKVNGIDINFVLDTGCTDLQISCADFSYMKNMGAISDSNVDNIAECVYADGRADTCAVIKIDSISIGDIVVRNVNATISNSIDAPRLLGQSVLSKFGSVSFDYKNKKLKIGKDDA